MPIFFRNIKILTEQIDEFFNAVSQGAIVFKQGMSSYLENNRQRFAEQIQEIDMLENRADELRRHVENQLYTHSLIPEYRGDVLSLLESMDDIIDTSKKILNQFMIESPDVLPGLKAEFLELTEIAVLAIDSVVASARAFFNDVLAIKNYLHKVYFYEKESDKLAGKLKTLIFQQNINLSQKMHLRDFADYVDSLSDCAEIVADRLTIYSIKRMI